MSQGKETAMRTDRASEQTHTMEREMRLRCHHVILLNGVEYDCKRQFCHGGVHDAFIRHSDGGLVMW